MQMQLLHPDEARSELESKSLLDIEEETAKTWGARAAAAFQLAKETTGEIRTKWIMDAENYRQESLEHAAMTGDIEFIRKVMTDLDNARSEIEHA